MTLILGVPGVAGGVRSGEFIGVAVGADGTGDAYAAKGADFGDGGAWGIPAAAAVAHVDKL